MPRRKDSKYNRKYCKQLVRGLRREGLSINKVCQLWEITRTTYNKWRDEYPEFDNAHQVGQRDYCVFLEDKAMDVAFGKTKGNAGMMIFALKNAEGLGWTDKVEVQNNTDEQIKQINISILPPPSPNKLISIDSNSDLISNDIIDYEIIDES